LPKKNKREASVLPMENFRSEQKKLKTEKTKNKDIDVFLSIKQKKRIMQKKSLV
jgi:hypothetical protein